MTVKIGFTGDFCPWLRIEELYNSGNWKFAFEEVKPFFEANNLNIIDLECPLTLPNYPIVKTGPHIHANPQTAEILNYLNCSLVATANNHMFDYGVKGLNSTYEALKKKSIKWIGSGLSLEDASKIHFQEIEGMVFSFINFTENEWSTTNGNQPGCNPLDPIGLFYKIQLAKQKSDFVIVIAHGGHEHYNLPSPRIKKLYRYLIDVGASAIISHHTHIISGFEEYKDAPIFYSLGNFCFDWEGLRSGTWNKGMIVSLEFQKGAKIKVNRKFVEHNTEEIGLKFIKGEEENKLESHVNELNKVIQNDDLLEKEFTKFANEKRKLMNTWIEPYRGKILPGLHYKGLIPSLMTPHKKRLLSVLIKCESHKDILLNALKLE